jgi:hypothetical protein
VPRFGGTEKLPVPDPVPEAVSVIHETVVDDVHAQPAWVVTVIVTVPPPPGTVTSTGVTENVQDGLGSVTTNVWPAIVKVADRSLVVVFAPAVKLIVPEPVRPVPLEMVTHVAPLVALQVHVAPVVMLTLLVPPFAVIASPAGEIVNVHGGAACVIVKTLVPIVIVPVREVVPVLAVTE